MLVIGLGRFGSATAAQLVHQNKEVLAVEKDPVLVQKWSGDLTHVVEADATDMNALRQSINDLLYGGTTHVAPAAQNAAPAPAQQTAIGNNLNAPHCVFGCHICGDSRLGAVIDFGLFVPFS